VGATTFGKRGAKAPAPVRVAARAASVAALDAAPIAMPELAPSAPGVSSVETGLPLATGTILLLLLVVFVCEVKFAPLQLSGMTIPTGASIGYGASSGDLVLHNGQWWRLFTAPLLHGSLGHIFGNAMCFGIIGFMLEPVIGSRWFSALFAIGAIGGSIGSLIFNAANIPTVGASGAIMGVLAGAFICGAFIGEDGPRMRAPLWLGFFLPHLWLARIFGSAVGNGQTGWRMQTWALFLMLPALVPMTMTSHTDYGAHLGGVITGAMTGVVMQASWAPGERYPAHGNAMAGFAIAWLAIALASFAYGAHSVAAASLTPPGMIPIAEMPEGIDVGHDKAVDLVTRYPGDPRSHLIRAVAFVHDNDLTDAEDQLRAALALKDKLDPEMAEVFEKEVRVILAMTVSYEGKPDEAKTIGTPLCEFAHTNMGEDIFKSMQRREICPSE
jgi:rhomboid protease GluP